MNLRFLGTGAAGGFPNPHCRCENCMAARSAGGPSIRRMCSVMIDDDLLIDLGPDVPGACVSFGLDLADVRWVLQTHDHGDHLLPVHASIRAASWAAQNAMPMQWFANKHAIQVILDGNTKALSKMDMVIDEPGKDARLMVTTIAPWQQLKFGDYKVLTIPANHGSAKEPMLFAINKGGRSLLYASDTSELPADVWPRVSDMGWKFDVVVFDHNDGFARRWSNTHSGSEGVRHEMVRMGELGLVEDSTKLFGTHLGHHSNSVHEVESKRAQAYGYDIAFDGLVVRV